MLLLGVTRIPTSPTPVRRPCSLPLTATTQLLPFTPNLNPNPNPNPDRSTDPVLVQEQAGVCGSSSSSNPTTTTTVTSSSATVTPRSHVSPDSRRAPLLMDQSVDSIGTCSLDVDASYELQGICARGRVDDLRGGFLGGYLRSGASNTFLLR